jgi:hypothetical protein
MQGKILRLSQTKFSQKFGFKKSLELFCQIWVRVIKKDAKFFAHLLGKIPQIFNESYPVSLANFNKKITALILKSYTILQNLIKFCKNVQTFIKFNKTEQNLTKFLLN